MTTNNRMELMAVITGLEALSKKCSVVVTSDSKYVINAMIQGWLTRWRDNGWVKKDRQKVKNTDLWKRILVLNDGHDIEWLWVKGHADHERCDVLATEAILSGDHIPDEGYLDEIKEDKELF